MLHLIIAYSEEHGETEVNPELDEKIKDFFISLGFTHTGQAIDAATNERDMSFRLHEEDSLNLSDDDEDALETCEGCEKPAEHTRDTDDGVSLCKPCYDECVKDDHSLDDPGTDPKPDDWDSEG